jgi:hypothetical protein
MHRSRGSLSVLGLILTLFSSGAFFAGSHRLAGPEQKTNAEVSAALTAAADLEALFSQPANCMKCETCLVSQSNHTADFELAGPKGGTLHTACTWGSGDECPHPACTSGSASTANASEALASLVRRVQLGELGPEALKTGEFAEWIRVDPDGGLDVYLPCNPSALLARVATDPTA